MLPFVRTEVAARARIDASTSCLTPVKYPSRHIGKLVDVPGIAGFSSEA